MEFKINDEVKIIQNTSGSVNKIGDIGIIEEIHGEWYRVLVKGRSDFSNNHREYDLALTNNEEYEIY